MVLDIPYPRRSKWKKFWLVCFLLLTPAYFFGIIASHAKLNYGRSGLSYFL